MQQHLKAGKQEQFHNDRYKIFARLISAGTGAGKTRAGTQEAWLWTWECPGSVGLLFEPTYGMIRRNLLPTLEEILDCPVESSPYIKQFNAANNRIEWINGTVWWLLSLNEPERAEGINADWIWADEFRLVGGSGPVAKRKQETSWNVMVRRLRGSTLGKYPTGLWITTTPDEPGSILYNKFERPDTKIPGSKIYRWTIFDNPFLPASYIEEVKRSHVEGTGLYNRFILGLFASVAAGTFNFDSSIHVTSKLPPQENIRKWVYGVDWGWTHPTAVIAVGLDYDDRAYIYEEFYQSRATVETIIQVCRDFTKKYADGTFYCDKAEPRNIDALCTNGLAAIANTTKRDDGIRELGSRFAVQGDQKPRILIHEDCVNLISELQVYDENIKQFDDATDALRYALINAKVYPPLGGDAVDKLF